MLGTPLPILNTVLHYTGTEMVEQWSSQRNVRKAPCALHTAGRVKTGGNGLLGPLVLASWAAHDGC